MKYLLFILLVTPFINAENETEALNKEGLTGKVCSINPKWLLARGMGNCKENDIIFTGTSSKYDLVKVCKHGTIFQFSDIYFSYTLRDSDDFLKFRDKYKYPKK